MRWTKAGQGALLSFCRVRGISAELGLRHQQIAPSSKRGYFASCCPSHSHPNIWRRRAACPGLAAERLIFPSYHGSHGPIKTSTHSRPATHARQSWLDSFSTPSPSMPNQMLSVAYPSQAGLTLWDPRPSNQLRRDLRPRPRGGGCLRNCDLFMMW